MKNFQLNLDLASVSNCRIFNVTPKFVAYNLTDYAISICCKKQFL